MGSNGGCELRRILCLLLHVLKHYNQWIAPNMSPEPATILISLGSYPRCVWDLSCFTENYEHLIRPVTLVAILKANEWVSKPSFYTIKLSLQDVTSKISDMLLFDFWESLHNDFWSFSLHADSSRSYLLSLYLFLQTSSLIFPFLFSFNFPLSLTDIYSFTLLEF